MAGDWQWCRHRCWPGEPDGVCTLRARLTCITLCVPHGPNEARLSLRFASGYAHLLWFSFSGIMRVPKKRPCIGPGSFVPALFRADQL
jgi:hypothetical protein